MQAQFHLEVQNAQIWERYNDVGAMPALVIRKIGQLILSVHPEAVLRMNPNDSSYSESNVEPIGPDPQRL